METNNKKIAWKKRTLCVLAAALLTLGLAACTTDEGEDDETGGNDTKAAVTTTAAATDGETTDVTGSGQTTDTTVVAPETTADPEPTVSPETTAVPETTMTPETTVEPETTMAPGIFTDPTHLSGFDKDTNKSYITQPTNSSVAFNEDGTVTLLGTWKEGAAFTPQISIKYAQMMMKCYTGYTALSDLPNGGEQSYPVLVFKVKMTASITGETSLNYIVGKSSVTGSAVPVYEPIGTDEISYIIFDLSKDEKFNSDFINTLTLGWGYGIGAADNLGASLTLYEIRLFKDLDEAKAYTGVEIVGQNGTEKEDTDLDVNMSDLNELMQPIFMGNSVMNETVMFLDPGDSKTLLYNIDQVISVTNYDGSITYMEGKDYKVEDGKLVALAGGSIPCITGAKYYNNPGSLISINHNGQTVPIHWGEGKAMTDWQVNVAYTHSGEWSGYMQSSNATVYENFINKLQAGEDVTIFFYGDSITYGANASWLNGYTPYQYSYPILLTQALADLFDYTVHYEAANLTAPSGMATSKVPSSDYVAGTRGTITYVNTAIGGWTSTDGVNNFNTFVKNKIDAYGCDLFIVGYGMNDGASDVRTVTRANTEKIVDGVLALKPEASILMVSTMVPNPDGIGWYTNQPNQEAQLLKSAAQYRADGVPCAVACVTSVSQAILERKDFHDYSGNNINHPNDFFVRVYAQTLLQALIGYNNMN